MIPKTPSTYYLPKSRSPKSKGEGEKKKRKGGPYITINFTMAQKNISSPNLTYYTDLQLGTTSPV